MKAEGQHLIRMLPPFIFLTNRRIFEVPPQLCDVEVATPLPTGSPSGTVTTNPFEVVPDARPLCGAYLNGAAKAPASISDWRAIWNDLLSFIRRRLALGRVAMAAEAAKSGLGAKRAMDELALALLSIRLGMLNLDQAGVAFSRSRIGGQLACCRQMSTRSLTASTALRGFSPSTRNIFRS